MASPQKENGYTSIANEIMDALISYRLPGEQRQVLDSIFRKTYGFNKKSDAISLSQFVLMTGLKKPNVIRSIQGLLSKKIISVIKKDNAPAHVYEFNKNYDEWEPLSKKITVNMPGRISIDEIKAKIRKRDNNSCVLCGFDGMLSGQFLPVHHIDFNQTNNINNNLITLCKSCHAKSHTVAQKDMLSKKIISVIKKDNASLSKVIPTKDNTTKDNTTKDIKIYAQKNDFDQFYLAYPKKKSKNQAKKTWDKLIKQKNLPDISIILNSIAAQKAGHDWQKDGGKWIPYPSSWLNGGCWDDEIVNRQSDMRPETFQQGLKAQIMGRNKWLLEEMKNERANTQSNSAGACKAISELSKP